MNELASTAYKRPRWLVPAIAAALLMTAVCAASAGFVAGRLDAENQVSASAGIEIVTREVAVTREIEVTAPPSSAAPTPTSGTSGGSSVAEEPATPDAQPSQIPDDTGASTGLEDLDFAVFYEVWRIVGEQFDGEIPSGGEALTSAIQGSLTALDDDNTRFIPEEIAERLREEASGSVSGIGAYVRENDDGFIEIVAPMAGQPAELVGLLAGDLIVAVDGQSVEGMSLDEVVLLVRGTAGTEVHLTIAREGLEEHLEFKVVRVQYDVPTVEYKILDDEEGKIAYIRLIQFNANAEQKMLEALQDLLAQRPVGLILDLRNNPGGFVNQTVAVADLFLPDAVIFTERNRQGLNREFRADDGDIGEDIPIVVLVNGGSASASEIVAGSFRAAKRGILIGETTFGKGSVQTVNQLSDGSELRVTVARWYTGDGLSIDAAGIEPDIEVEMPATVVFGSEEDVQLQRAISYLHGLN